MIDTDSPIQTWIRACPKWFWWRCIQNIFNIFQVRKHSRCLLTVTPCRIEAPKLVIQLTVKRFLLALRNLKSLPSLLKYQEVQDDKVTAICQSLCRRPLFFHLLVQAIASAFFENFAIPQNKIPISNLSKASFCNLIIPMPIVFSQSQFWILTQGFKFFYV